MRRVSVRELRLVLAELEGLLEQEGELAVTCRGRAIARLLPVSPVRTAPTHADLRKEMSKMVVGSEVLVRAERDEG